MKISVAITVRNDRSNMAPLLDSLAKQSRAPDELVVVDAHSTDGTWELVEGFARTAPFPVVAVQHAGSRGAGRSECVRRAGGDVVAFIDSDCEVSPDWVARYERAWAEEQARAPAVPLGAIGGANHTPPSSTALQHAIDDVMSVMEEASFHGINTINCCYLREAAAKAGLFDDDLHTAEDPDLNARIAKLGYRLTRVDNPCWHKRRDSWRKLVRQHYEYGKGAVSLLDRHPEYFPRIERIIPVAGAAAALVLLALGLFASPWFLALIPLGVVGVPLYTHRRLAHRFLQEHGVGRAWLQRLGVLWVVYVPYQCGVLAERGGRLFMRTPAT